MRTSDEIIIISGGEKMALIYCTGLDILQTSFHCFLSREIDVAFASTAAVFRLFIAVTMLLCHAQECLVASRLYPIMQC